MVPIRSKNRIFQPTGSLLIVGGIHEVGVDVQGDDGLACPNWVWMYLMFSPFASRILAFVCRRSWNLTLDKSAAFRAGRK